MALKSPYKKTRDVAVIAGKRPHQLVCLSQYLRSAVAEDKPKLKGSSLRSNNLNMVCLLPRGARENGKQFFCQKRAGHRANSLRSYLRATGTNADQLTD